MDDADDHDFGNEASKESLRRPMNAFLIFCKKHRTLVRGQHPDLDNRGVTKVLGDLWANLPSVEKESFLELAKQVKGLSQY